MHAHRVDILDGADDDAVVVLVADDLHLVLLPAEHRLLDQHLTGGRGVEPALDDLEELLAVIGDAAAGAAQREGGADDGGKADVLHPLERLDQAFLDIAPAPLALVSRPVRLEVEHGFRTRLRIGILRLDARDLFLVGLPVGALQRGGVGEPRAWCLEPDRVHGLTEQLAVLGLVDHVGLGADHLHAEMVQHAGAVQAERGVEPGLPAHGWQQRVWPLLFDDLGDDVRRDGLDIGGVGELRVRHDRGRVRVHQHDPVALVLERLAGLRAGIVELAGLADYDRSGPDDQDGLYVCAFGHGLGGVTGLSAPPSARRSG